MLMINVYHGGQIPNTSTSVGYDIHAACTFFADKAINFHDLKRHIHASSELPPSKFNISISAWINTATTGSGNFFIAYLRLFLMKFCGMIKTTAPYQLSGV
jgi:hypothetical protein